MHWGEFFQTEWLFIKVRIICKSFRICSCGLEYSYFDSDQDKITENEMIIFYSWKGGVNFSQFRRVD